MICTEEEAGGKWCPQVRLFAPSPVETAGAASYNRSPFEVNPAGNTGCIGSACMLWDWVDPEIEREWIYWPTSEDVEVDGWKIAPDGLDEANSCMMLVRPIPPELRKGTCGLIHRSGE